MIKTNTLLIGKRGESCASTLTREQAWNKMYDIWEGLGLRSEERENLEMAAIGYLKNPSPRNRQDLANKLVTTFGRLGLAKQGILFIYHLWGQAKLPPNAERLLFKAIQEEVDLKRRIQK